MAVQMTRKEYEAKYGVAPILNTSTLDTTPAPARMTREEYNQIYRPKEEGGFKKVGGQIKESFVAGTEKSTKGFEKITEAVGEIKDVKNPTQAKDLYKKVIRGELRFLGGAVDAAFAPLAPIFAPIGTGVSKVADKIGSIPAVQRFASGDEGQERIEKTQDVLDLVNISSVIPVGKLAGGAVSSISKGVPKAIENTKVALRERAVNKLADEVLNVENSYNKTAIKNTLSDDTGKASRQRIANTDVLTGLVDEDGKITFDSAKKAAESYRKQTIDGAEGVVRDILKNEGKTINAEQVRQILTEEIASTGLQGADLVAALSGIKKEIAGLKLRANEFGDIPLSIIHDSKIGATKYINYDKPVEVSYRNSVANAYRKTVENYSKANVEVGGKLYNIKQVNEKLGVYLGDIKRIEALGGKKVKGGRLGKYSSQIAGNLAGAAVGGAFGGPFGMAVGTVVGGEVASKLRGKQMASTFGKAKGKITPKDAVIEGAKLKAKEGAVTDLRTPDAKVGVNKSIPKTKEIIKTERLIAKNVDEQKKAIKAGNFTLVATLKEIYQVLVNKLKNLIKEFKEIPNREGGFIKINGSSKVDNQQGKGKVKSTASNKSTTTSNGSQVDNSYKGEKDLTTKILKDLEGKTTVSKQYIIDATNRGEMKQVERDLIRSMLADETATVKVADFAKKVKAELLPLKVKTSPKSNKMASDGFRVTERGNKYENISLPDELRGKVKNYSENIYESPIKTSAGQTHFNGQSDNYFGHTRIEDMADNKTRRVIEVQSDLYQKGNLEKEMPSGYGYSAPEITKILSPEDAQKYQEALRVNRESNVVLSSTRFTETEKQPIREARETIDKLESKAVKVINEKRANELKPLQQYNDPTAHFRMVREELKKASDDGIKKVQFPTGETAMKIEGLGATNSGQRWGSTTQRAVLTPDNLRVGDEVGRIPSADDFTPDVMQKWIITDVLGDGKFKAVPKEFLDAPDFMVRYKKRLETGVDELTGVEDKILADEAEAFDISGKVDTNNPIYKFYEKDVQNYLKKFGGQRITDAQGVEWIEVPVKKEWAKMPVEAFALAPLLLNEKE